MPILQSQILNNFVPLYTCASCLAVPIKEYVSVYLEDKCSQYNCMNICSQMAV